MAARFDAEKEIEARDRARKRYEEEEKLKDWVRAQITAMIHENLPGLTKAYKRSPQERDRQQTSKKATAKGHFIDQSRKEGHLKNASTHFQ